MRTGAFTVEKVLETLVRGFFSLCTCAMIKCMWQHAFFFPYFYFVCMGVECMGVDPPLCVVSVEAKKGAD